MSSNRRVYPKICENPECLKDFLATGKDARFCSRECRGQHSKDVLSKIEGKDYLPMTKDGYFDADAFTKFFYPNDKLYGKQRVLGGELSFNKFTND